MKIPQLTSAAQDSDEELLTQKRNLYVQMGLLRKGKASLTPFSDVKQVLHTNSQACWEIHWEGFPDNIITPRRAASQN